MLWDRGSWTPAPGKDPVKTLEKGHLHFTLDGERMKGEWILIRLKPRERERTENWLLRKIEDQHAGSSAGLTEKYLTSVKTGRTMNEIAQGKKAKELIPPRHGEGDHAKHGGGAPTRSNEAPPPRTEEHTSELQSLMRNAYAVSCLKN